MMRQVLRESYSFHQFPKWKVTPGYYSYGACMIWWHSPQFRWVHFARTGLMYKLILCCAPRSHWWETTANAPTTAHWYPGGRVMEAQNVLKLLHAKLHMKAQTL